MGVSGLVLRSRWRRSVAAQLVLALVLVLTGSLAFATLAGARRTETADERFLAEVRPPDLFFSISGFGGNVYTDEQVEAVRTLPMVAASSRLRALSLTPEGTDLYQPAAAPADQAWFHDLSRTRFVQGRAPEGPEELSVTEQRAALLGLSVGDTLTMVSYTPAQIDAAMQGDDSVFANPEGPTIAFTLVGIERTPQSIGTDRDIASLTMTSPSFLEKYGDRVGSWNEMLAVSLDEGLAGIDDFTARVHEVPGLEGVSFEVATTGSTTGATVGFVAMALRVVALLVAVVGLALVGLLVSRSVLASANEDGVLLELGVGQAGRRVLHGLEMAPAIVLGICGAIVGAILLSPMFPFGLAGRAEPDPGVHVDAVVLAAGTLVLVLAVGALTLLAARRSERLLTPTNQVGRPSWLAARLRHAGAPLTVTLGSRFVLDRGAGARAVPARLAIAGVALGSAGLVAVLVFSASQIHLENDPAAWGRTWDLAVPTGSPDVEEVLVGEDVVARSTVRAASLQVEGVPTEVRGFTTAVGSPMLPVVSGRVPGPNEIALGASTMRELGLHLGDRVLLAGGGGEREVEVVGQAVMSGISDAPVLAAGGVVLDSTFAAVVGPDADVVEQDILRLGSGSDREALAARLAPLIGAGTAEEEVARIAAGDRPDEFERLDEVRVLPWVLAAGLGALATAATASLLVSAVRRRSRDVAVLRAAGMEGAGVRRILVNQAITVSLLGLLIGLPVGVVTGRTAWQAVAQDLGVAVDLVVPLLGLVAIAIVIVGADVVVSLVPARRAVRERPAQALRAE